MYDGADVLDQRFRQIDRLMGWRLIAHRQLVTYTTTGNQFEINGEAWE